MDVSLQADRAYTGRAEWYGMIRVSGMSGCVAGGESTVIEFLYLRAVFELVLSLSSLVLQFSSLLAGNITASH